MLIVNADFLRVSRELVPENVLKRAIQFACQVRSSSGNQTPAFYRHTLLKNTRMTPSAYIPRGVGFGISVAVEKLSSQQNVPVQDRVANLHFLETDVKNLALV